MKRAQEVPSRRPYDASGRRRRAEERRIEVIRCALTVFSEKGLESTTMADLAAAAGVSVPYLERLGTKADLFAMVIEHSTLGPETQTVERARKEFDKVAHLLSRDELIAHIARGSAEWNERSHRLWRMWAISTDTALQARWQQNMSEIRGGWEAFLTRFDDRGWWRSDIARSEQAATLWILTLAETYGRLVEDAGLTHEEYVLWLERGVRAALVGDG
ncbi:TetR/AcrR family transcriptional regulator [Microbacterium lacus]|uniref:TetR/AcrR family transcriptional regulator n=1 Tax=Microbacterium lacus TaxID=415217 RepID=UPI003850D6DE